MEIAPEIITVVGAPIVAWLVGGLRQSRWGQSIDSLVAVAATVVVGILVAALLYLSGFVDLEGLTPAQITARAVLAGFGIAMAASGARSWSRAND